jgi:Bacterial Ig-like domain/RTX calcium-binding nonapeptide repeat (4 copies)
MPQFASRSIVITRSMVVVLAAVLAAGWLSASPRPTRAAGSISLVTLGDAYTQDFGTLNTLGTANAISAAVGMGGWELTESGGSARDNEQYAASTGSDANGDTFSYGASSALLDRALGGLRGTALVPIFGAAFTNNTGATVIKLDVAYTGEMFRAGVLNRGLADRIDFQLSLDATSLTTGTWVDYDALDFSSPNVNTTVGAKDGNASAFRTALTHQITALSVTNGASFWIRWTDFDITGLDDGLAVDDFSITPRGVDDVAPGVSATTPADGAEDVAVDANPTVTFSEDVNVADTAFDVTCTASGTHSAVVSGGPATFTIDPDTNFHQHEHCTVTIDADGVNDADATDPPDTMVADAAFTFRVANPAPTFSIVAGDGCTANNGSFVVTIDDLETAQANLRLMLTDNTNPTLVPNANVSISGAAARTIWVTAAGKKAGGDKLTFTVSDGVNDVAFDINVLVGTNADDAFIGTDGSDLLVGSNGADVLSGLGGADVLCGGNGDDLLAGGDGHDLLSGDRGDDSLTGDADGDAFSGGAGADAATDLNLDEGDTSDET